MKGRKKEGERTNRRAEMGDHPRHRKGKNAPHGAGGNRRIISVGIHEAAFFGGRIAAHTDLNTIAELRRIGGLLKHNFETLRSGQSSPGCFERQEEACEI